MGCRYEAACDRHLHDRHRRLGEEEHGAFEPELQVMPGNCGREGLKRIYSEAKGHFPLFGECLYEPVRYERQKRH